MLIISLWLQIATLMVTSENRHCVLNHPDGIRQLNCLASSPFASVQEAAARAFVNLSYEGDGARAIVQAGSIIPITELLNSPLPQVQQEAIWVVVNLSVLPENESGETAPLL